MKRHFTYKLLVVAAILSAALIFTACDAGTEASNEQTADKTQEQTSAPVQESADTPQAAEETEAMDEENMDEDKVFTLEELSGYDGKDGRPAYVAVDGVVYDVSDKPLWAGGEHQNKVSAGLDLSEAILQSPHGKAKLKDLPVVGKLAGE